MEQGHVRVGPDTITDPAFLVTRNMEDFVTWVDTSKIKRHVQKYNVSTAVLLPRPPNRAPSDIARTYRTSWTTSISWPSTCLFSSFSLSQAVVYITSVPYPRRLAMHLLLITEPSPI